MRYDRFADNRRVLREQIGALLQQEANTLILECTVHREDELCEPDCEMAVQEDASPFIAAWALSFEAASVTDRMSTTGLLYPDSQLRSTTNGLYSYGYVNT